MQSASARDLPSDLKLPLASGAPWWYWLGGRPAIDLVNTLRERWWRRAETLVTPDDLAAWIVATGLATSPPPTDDAQLERARSLREAIDIALVATLDGDAIPAAARETIDGWLPATAALPRLVANADGGVALVQVAAETGADAILARIALDAAQMLGTDERARIRVCASETCSARFYDRSPGGDRRWCSMQACGNAAKARRHRARARRDQSVADGDEFAMSRPRRTESDHDDA
jgi:predicted RNA-binding Zn ribbon-like protein